MSSKTKESASSLHTSGSTSPSRNSIIESKSPSSKSPPLNEAFDANAFSAEEDKKRSAPRGKCKFDGTDYPDWLPINPFKQAEEPFTYPFPEVEGDPWAKAGQLVKDYDDGMCNSWVDEIQNILLFAGLFSAVVTAFAVETQKMLQPDPNVASVLLLAHLSTQLGNNTIPTSTILAPFQVQKNPTQALRINALIHFSLVLSLGTALVGIIALQWIRSYRKYESQAPKDRIPLRHFRYQSLVTWKVPEIISALPVVLQASLVLFFAGLIDYLCSLSSTIAIIIASLIGVILAFVLFTMVVPGLHVLFGHFFHWRWIWRLHHSTPSPYQSPQSWLFLQCVLFMKSTCDPIFNTLSGQKEQYIDPVMKAANWTQLVQTYMYFAKDRELYIGVSLGWIIKNFADVESFFHLFHCFQTLQQHSMQSALVAIRGEDDEDLIWSKVIPLRPESPGVSAVEKKHLLTTVLINWAQSHHWMNGGINLYELELSLRCMTYSVPPECPETRMVPSRLPLWHNMMVLPSDHRNELWTFGFLVALQEPETPFAQLDPFLRQVLMATLWLNVDYLYHRHSTGSLDIIEDIFKVFGNWLGNLQVAGSDGEVTTEGPWQRELMTQFTESVYFRSDVENTSSYCVDLRLLIQRPSFLAVLDKFANHPQAHRFWKQCAQLLTTDDMPKNWDNFLVNNSLEKRYSALVHDCRRVDRLVKERGNPTLAPTTGIQTLSDGDGLYDEKVLVDVVTNPVSGSSKLATPLMSGRDSPVDTVLAAIKSYNGVRVTPAYSPGRPDIELGYELDLQSQSTVVVASDTQEQQTSGHIAIRVDSRDHQRT